MVSVIITIILRFLYTGVYGIRTRGLHNANVARSQLR